MMNKESAMPWSEDLPLSPLRMVWIFGMLIFGMLIVRMFNIPDVQSMLAVELLALVACIGTYPQLGMKKLEGKDIIAVFLFYIGMMLLVMLISLPWDMFLERTGTEVAEKQEVLNDVAANTQWRERIFMYLAVCVVTPVVEEVLFRRIIYGMFLKKMPVAVAVFLTSALFAVIHFFIKGLPALFIMGVSFQLIYLTRKNLYSSILLHSLVNTVAFCANT